MPVQTVKAPMKATVIRFHAEQGAALKNGDRVCDLEAMKMEVPIMAPADGTLKEILASPGQKLRAGDGLFTLES